MSALTIGSAVLLITLPILTPLITYASLEGIGLDTLAFRLATDPMRLWARVHPMSIPTLQTCATLALFWGGAMLFYWLPGERAAGVITPTGHMPLYTDNGRLHMALFTLVFCFGAMDGFYPWSILYDELHRIVCAHNVFFFAFSVFLYVKGRLFPDTLDVTFTGRGLLNDIYAGIELYPRIFGFDVKKLVNCRFSMTFWMLFGISAAHASFAMHGTLDYGLMWNAIVTYVYLVKFFMWEIGYMRSIDIIEDNAGFMETWGCAVFVPALYTNHMNLAVKRPTHYSFEAATALGIGGLLCALMNYWTDRQRQVFRETNGKSMLWWPTPPRSLHVDYTITTQTGENEQRETLLLLNGFWGMVRHPQYIFEMGLAFFWGMLGDPIRNGVQPMLYFFLIVVLLTQRAHRDAAKCKLKYGSGYSNYVANVPYLLIPKIY